MGKFIEPADALRGKAAHARQLAKSTYDRVAAERLNAFADKCMRDADANEAQAAPLGPEVPEQHVASSSSLSH